MGLPYAEGSRQLYDLRLSHGVWTDAAGVRSGLSQAEFVGKRQQPDERYNRPDYDHEPQLEGIDQDGL